MGHVYTRQKPSYSSCQDRGSWFQLQMVLQLFVKAVHPGRIGLLVPVTNGTSVIRQGGAPWQDRAPGSSYKWYFSYSSRRCILAGSGSWFQLQMVLKLFVGSCLHKAAHSGTIGAQCSSYKCYLSYSSYSLGHVYTRRSSWHDRGSWFQLQMVLELFVGSCLHKAVHPGRIRAPGSSYKWYLSYSSGHVYTRRCILAGSGLMVPVTNSVNKVILQMYLNSQCNAICTNAMSRAIWQCYTVIHTIFFINVYSVHKPLDNRLSLASVYLERYWSNRI